MIRVLSVFGTRPEAVKMAPVVRELQKRSDRFESRVCVTAQHRELLDRVIAVFGLAVDYDLDLMRPDQAPAETAAAVLGRLPELIREVEPTLLLVQGDTTTTLTAALAAFLERVPTGHVEAGLRTGNLKQPFPEEMNRVLTSRLAAIHFAPTERARANLLAEGIADQDIVVTGNTVIDALRQASSLAGPFEDGQLEGLRPGARLVLVTTHRRESFGPPLQSICAALGEISKRFPDLEFVVPVHPNPNVRGTLAAQLGSNPAFRLVEPLAYADFVRLLNRAHLVLTDSGGIQEEAPALGKPVLVLRDVTERSEGVDAGTAILVGTDRNRIVEAASTLLTDADAYARMARAVNPYGDGRAAERIVDALESRFG